MCGHSRERAPAGIKWHDLTSMSGSDILRELALPLPWLLLSWWLYASAYWPLGVGASFMFFLCGLRLNHEAIHGNLGLARGGDSLVMHGLSFLMAGSNHAFAHGHLVHHRHSMGPEDFEGKCGEMTFWEILRYCPRFPLDVNRVAWAGSKSRARRRIVVDWSLNALMLLLAFWIGGFVALHVTAMVVAQCLTAFFAVWITHRGASDVGIAARSQRGILARAAYLMFYHREHHLYPKVPVRRLPDLAGRLDCSVPGYAAQRMPVVQLFDHVEARHA